MGVACDGIYNEWVAQMRALSATPELRQRYAYVLATAGQLLNQANNIRSQYYNDDARCALEMDRLYSQVSHDLQKGGAIQAGETGKDAEFPWTAMARNDIHLSRGIQVMSGMRDYRDVTGRTLPDTLLSASVRQALRKYWRLNPVGTETLAMLEDRIVSVFMQRYADNWNAGLTPEDIIGDVSLSEVVADISPMSARVMHADIVRAPEISIDWTSLALIGLGVGALLHFGWGFVKKGKRRA